MKKIAHIVLIVAGFFATNAVVAAHYHVDFYNYTAFPMQYHVVTSGKDHNHEIAAASIQTIATESSKTEKKTGPGAVQTVTTTDPNTGKTITQQITPGHEYFKTKGGGDMFKKFE